MNSLVDFEAAVRSAVQRELHSLLNPLVLDSLVERLSAGRQLRSRIAFYASRRRDAALVDACVALELLHVSSLVHDDIVDHALTRRGEPSVVATKGNDLALYVGNMVAARSMVVGCRSLSRETLQMLVTTCEHIDVAQALELQDRGSFARSVERYWAIVEGKTAAIIQLAVAIGHGEPLAPTHPISQAMSDFAAAFQLHDDIEDVECWLGRKDARQKGGTLDLDNGTYTAPALLACREHGGLGDIRAIDPRQITPAEWDRGLQSAKQLAQVRSSAAKGRFTQALDGPWSQLSGLMLRILEGLDTTSIDETVVRT